MKIKQYNVNPQVLLTNRVEKLGLNWQDLFNPSLAIHANRELNMSKISLVGFDMDYTLAVYKKRPMEFWQYQLAREYLINNMGYSINLTKSNYDANLVIRGLVIDKHLGTILKVDDQNHVWRASFGKKPMSAEQIAHIYGSKRIKISDSRFYSLDTFFSIPEACLFIDTILSLDPLNPSALPQIFADIRNAMDTIHSNGSLKTIIGDRIEEFIEQDGGIEQAVRKLRKEGKKTFLLTNSRFDYTNTVLNFVFHGDENAKKSWLDLFDWIIVEAEKPKFFTEQKPFLSHMIHEGRPESKTILVGGNIHDFQRMCGVAGPEVLYVGDHIYGDVLRSKKESLWRTCLIVKELNFEIRKSLELKNDFNVLHQIHHEQAQTDNRLLRLRTLLTMLQNQPDKDEEQTGFIEELKREIRRSTSLLRELKERYTKLNHDLEHNFHPVWGRLFREEQELSRFGAQVRQYACIYTDHVKNFLHYGANHTFFAKKMQMSHEMDDEG
jgi:5'-nucleotidase